MNLRPAFDRLAADDNYQWSDGFPIVIDIELQLRKEFKYSKMKAAEKTKFRLAFIEIVDSLDD